MTSLPWYGKISLGRCFLKSEVTPKGSERVDLPWMGRSTLRFVAILLWSGRSALFPRTSGIKPPVLSKFLRVFRELFIKSFLNGVWGNAPNSLFDRSNPEGLHHKILERSSGKEGFSMKKSAYRLIRFGTPILCLLLLLPSFCLWAVV